MKKYKIVVLLSVLFVVAACKKYEPYPIEKVTIDYVFDKGDSDAVSAQRFLMGVYAGMRTGHNNVGGDYLDAASDDAVSSAITQVPVTILATGAYSSLTLPSDENVWGSYYNGIRTATIFINNIENVPTRASVNGLSLKYILKSEARFLRAYFYYELIKRYGGVPLLGNKVYQLNDNIELPRNSFAQCVDFIVNECNAIQDSLITAPVVDGDSHRVTKGAAMALKARVLLYAASPLYNGGNIDAGNPLTGYTGYDENRWKLAADAAYQLLSLAASTKVYKLMPGPRDVFLVANNPELIFIQNGDVSTAAEQLNAPPGFPAPAGGGRTSPTQEFVDAFPMRSGLPITDPASGYDPNDPYGLNTSNQARKRDPRLDYTVFYNGSRWLQRNVQTFEGGLSKPNIGAQQTVTSYYLRKFMGKFEEAASITPHNRDWTVFRLPDVILDYAEAKNEVDGPTPEVRRAIESLRERAGILPGADKRYGIPENPTKDDMRVLIHAERRVELAFEQNRYFDIRRWKTAETVMNEPRTGLSIIKSGDDLEYRPIVVLNTKFIAPKMYLYPIPYGEVVKNNNMKQNPGW